MPIVVASRRIAPETLLRRFGSGAVLLDVTSRGQEPWLRYSPFYPHGGIPVPLSPGVFSASVEGIWQGLKVFEREGIDVLKFSIQAMRGIKRSSRAKGRVLGHQRGVHDESLLSYAEARRQIYLPSYRWVLGLCLIQDVAELRRLASDHTVVLLDYETNTEIDDLSRPLSHASLIKRYVEGTWPASDGETDREASVC